MRLKEKSKLIRPLDEQSYNHAKNLDFERIAKIGEQRKELESFL
jgi:excinuclease UvrABC nuclease subunit